MLNSILATILLAVSGSISNLSAFDTVGPAAVVDIPIDCNENGQDDDLDIISGWSSDINKNGIPDECEKSIVPLSEDAGRLQLLIAERSRLPFLQPSRLPVSLWR